jgi:hypothetical protein
LRIANALLVGRKCLNLWEVDVDGENPST